MSRGLSDTRAHEQKTLVSPVNVATCTTGGGRHQPMTGYRLRMDPIDSATPPVAHRGLDAGLPTTPRVWPPARRAVEAVFTGLAKLLRGRAFHPRGMSFEATIRPTETGRTLRVLPTDDGKALVRLSKGAGLPSRVPDVWGLAFRLPDVYGPERHQDVLLSTAGERPGLRHMLLPATGAERRRYSSLLPYRHRGRLVLLGARYAGAHSASALRIADLEDVARAGQLTFEVAVAGIRGPWRTVAWLTLGRRLPAEMSERLRFHPWNTSGDLRLVGPMSRLRAPAYEASQRTATSQ
jgi:hypothetical protein